ncbi:MAG: PEP/pyruvate-binding domain-containing protein [Candidatus Hodarchaeales archaeon]
MTENLELDYKPKYKIFHELMTKRINKVLLVSSYYDNFILEEDGRLSDQIFEEFHSLNLRTLPNITRVSSASEALSLLRESEFDLVITMRRLGGDFDPFSLGREIKEIQDIPVVLLLTNSANIPYLPDLAKQKGIDRIFVWNGDSKVFVAIIKHLEDRMNVDHDTKVGLVRVIIVIEDSIRFYSLFLPYLYSEIMRQTHRLISEGVNDYHNLLQMRARPKILLAETYEEAMDYYKTYKQYVIGIISDVRFWRNGVLDKKAGFDFLKTVRKENETLPIALQSSDLENKEEAQKLGAFFIYKKSRHLLKDLQKFMLNYLGFGEFKFKLEDGTIVGRAQNILELYNEIRKVPVESLIYHGLNDHFSGWLMTRAEFDIASRLKPRKVSEFKEPEDIRQFLLNSINEILFEKSEGVVHDFTRETHTPSIRFTRLRPGSLGGKGRGIAFLQFLLNSFLLADELSGLVSFRIPKTFVIGTDEFDRFMEDNVGLYDIALSDAPDDVIKQKFLESKVCNDLRGDLRFILKTLTGPLSVRSSSLLEDSQYQPFAGVFETYFLPNNPKKYDLNTRTDLLCDAIKLVYASTFLKQAKTYAESTGQSIEESKMAVVIQQVVGRLRKDNLSYPCFSGVASSYNYYPISYLKPTDRIAFLAMGLGKTIVDGGQSFRFCPKYPEVSFYSSQDQILNNTQKYFFAIDLDTDSTDFTKGEESFLKRLSIFDADMEVLVNVADSYDYNDKVLRDGYFGEGAPVITFSRQLKYNVVPLARLIQRVLELGEKAMGCSVEIEFAGNFTKDPQKKTTFYLLQIRPYTELDDTIIEEYGEIEKERLIASSKQVSGNTVIKNIYDLVYVNPETFDKLKTLEIAKEVDLINAELSNEKRPYILIGFGRWGTFDRFLGIPVKWHNISGARVMIEAGLEDYQIEHSQGSHFFQNITTANIPYFYIKHGSDDFLDWEWLQNPKYIIKKLKYICLVRTKQPFLVIANGKTRKGHITKPNGVY